MTITELNLHYGIPEKITFISGEGSLTNAVLQNQHGTAVISLYGAQVLSYIPKGEKDLLWMSEKTAFEKGKAIRGGIPLCFPWFGPHATDTTKPQHGFARLSEWNVKSTTVSAEDTISIILQLSNTAATEALWPFAFNAEIKLTINTKLELTLTCSNTDNKPFDYTNALHTYFNISDIATINIEGLEGATYFPAGAENGIIQKEKLVTFSQEENRRYLGHDNNCIITDKGMNRIIYADKKGSNTTVVWNPGAEIAKTIGDMNDNGYKTFVCVEPANAFTNIIKLSPGESFSISTIIYSKQA
ncbi:MAG: D-hexose-6-phosphate mutarotase [Sphingobacteriales bacterium]|nr:D-hexose-6-phosphate mutarotase [Sphingobacteriales bacterium]